MNNRVGPYRSHYCASNCHHSQTLWDPVAMYLPVKHRGTWHLKPIGNVFVTFVLPIHLQFTRGHHLL